MKTDEEPVRSMETGLKTESHSLSTLPWDWNWESVEIPFFLISTMDTRDEGGGGGGTGGSPSITLHGAGIKH